MGSEQQFCLRWHNYQTSLLASLPQLLDGDDLTDVTLMAGGCNVKAHRVVLSACSQYFKELFKLLQPLHHPVIVLPGTNFTDLCALVTFMYSGEVNIYQEQLQGLLSMADVLQIRGLAEVNGDLAKCTNTNYFATSKKHHGDPAVKRKTSYLSTPCSEKKSNTSTFSQNFQELPSSKRNLSCGTAYDEYGYKSEGSVCFSTKQVNIGPDTSSQNIRSTFDRPTLSVKRKATMNNLTSQILCQLGTNLSSSIDDQSKIPLITLPQESKSNDKHVVEMSSKSESETCSKIIDANIAMELESALKNTKLPAFERMDLKLSTMCDIQGLLSPSSESMMDKNNAGSYNVDHTTDKTLSSQGLQSKLSSSHYSKQWSQVNNKLFATCFVCGKQLSNQYNLRVHMETHQNVNYACKVCSHVSRSRDALRKHVSYRHPGEAKEKGGITERTADEDRIISEVEGDEMHNSKSLVAKNTPAKKTIP